MTNNNTTLGVKKFPPLFEGGPFIRYKMDPIDDPIYGKATFTRDIPLLLPFRGQTPEEILPDYEEVDRVAREMIELGRDVWVDDDDETVLMKLKEYTINCAIMSGMKVGDPRYPLFAYAMVLFIAMDDQLDGLDSMEQLSGSLKEFTDTYHGGDMIFRHSIPNATVGMARMMKHWEALKPRLLEIPDYMQKYEGALGHEISLFVQTHIAQSELKKHGLSFSETTSRELLRNIASPAICTEYVAILRDANIPKYVRDDVLFAVARNKVSDVEMLINAILGLVRDIQKGQIDSPIMMGVAEGQGTLQGELDKAYVELLDAMHDLKIATDKLLEVYPDDETVKTYVNIMVSGMDGFLYSHKFWARYQLYDKLELCEK